MDPVAIDVALIAGSVGLFAAAYVVARLVTRPARPAADPATPDLGDEPPAVVSLLANRWRLNEDASESTLLDLAARGYLELRQPGNDPRHTTIHLRQPAQPQPLRPYEQRVLDRIHDLAVEGVVPVTALTFRNLARAQRWNKRLHQEVVHDARARGLSQRRFGPGMVSALTSVSALSAVGVAIAGSRISLRDGEGPMGGIWFGVMAFALLAAFAARPMGERDTPAGRAVASRWLGVRRWLRGHEEFANLPPAAVAVWDRYLAFGAALGVTRVASAVLDLGMGDREHVWSSYQGQWRRVRVRYPSRSSRYGRTAPQLVLRGLASSAVGCVLLYTLGPPSQLWLPADRDPVDLAFEWALPLLAVLLLARGGYVLLRTIGDLATTRTITGEVLWVETWRSRSGGKNSKPVPWLHYVAVDDGHAERTVAWGLPATGTPSVHERDVVTIRVRPWSRRIVTLTVVEPGRTRSLRDAAVPTDQDGQAGALGAAFGALAARRSAMGSAGVPGLGSLPPARQLLRADEVSQALGLPVAGPEEVPTEAEPVDGAMFVSATSGHPVLVVTVINSRLGNWAGGLPFGRTPVPGVGDDAFVQGGRAMARIGEATVLLTLAGEALTRRDHLPWLLHQAAQRVPRQPEPRQPEPA